MTTSLPFSGALPLLLFVAKATMLLIVALIATVPLRRATAGSRHLVWLAALVGVLALPLLSRVESLRIGILPSVMSPSRDAQTFTPAAALAPIAPVTAIAPAIPATPIAPRAKLSSASTPADVSISVLSTIAFIWSAVALALIGWLVYGTISVRRIVDDARELTSRDWTTPLCEVADRLDLEAPPRLVVSDRTEMAFACRVLAPTIVLPAAAESWTDDRRRAVLFHELAHIKRHDLIGHTLGRLACALYWFHPLVWAAAKNLRAESERACDDLVLSCGARPSDYAQHLLEMVTSVRNYGAPIMALPMARKKEFEGRMLAILDPAIRRASPGRLQSAAVVTAIGLLSLTVAAVAPASPRVTSTPPAAIAAEPVAAPAPTPRPTPVAKTFAPEPSQGMPQPQGPQGDSQGQQSLQTPQVPQLPQPSQSAERAQSGDTSRAATLARILGTDTDARVRRTAAWGLSDLKTLAGRDALIRALRSDADGEVREMAAWSLSEYRGEVVLNALTDGLHDKNAKVRSTSAWGLGNNGSAKDAGELESAVSDADEEVREMAIWSIGQFNLKAAPQIVVNALTDNSQKVRLVAAWTLGEIGDVLTANAIVKAFQTETSSEVRQAEIRALGEMGKLPQTVLDVALKSTDPELRRRAVAAMAGGGDSSWPWPWPMPRPTP